ncbi:sugar phosphate isomerase/epimerase family protein [Myceligenerans salitolerans]|uniref:Sugar phosphate isomerase/epimerase n=1 Tax=Myceligenerans salitolerans TaxID=1230528 RepID=A0ABS3I6X6_9MICO|nr:sugar phosphate isomerase/epimerase [Myceligenerans salitolerans]MBO0608386.1 sugar phosphate isomerase/epimerase [Myceligenerans salitolerans]
MTTSADVKRRTFMRLAASSVAIGAGALAAATTAPAAAAQASGRGHGRRLVPPGHLGIQLYTIRDKVQSLGFRTVFERLSEMGYREIEFAGYSQGTGPITPEEIRTLLDDNGLTAIGAHRGIGDFAANMEAELDIAQTLGMAHLGTANAPTSDRTVDGYLAAAEQFNGFGEAAAARGLKFYQHNHDGEFGFATDRPDVRLYDVFLEHTDPRYVFLEMDVYWAFVGKHRYPGFEPVDYVLANRHRYPLFHIKDGRAEPETESGYGIVEFGAGDIDYQAFLGALAGSGRHHPIWEQDNAAQVAEPPHPLDSLGNAARSAERMLDLRAPRC